MSRGAPGGGRGLAAEDLAGRDHAVGGNQVDAAARGGDGEHAAVGRPRRVLELALVLGEAGQCAGFHVNREYVEVGSLVARGERDGRRLALRTPGGLLVVVALP